MGTPHRIDVHHHLFPPRYVVEATPERILGNSSAAQRGPLDWSPAKSIDEMDQNGIAASITSIAPPGVWFGDDQAACRLTRECNEYAARMTQDYPGRFGVFASLPLPDIDGTLREIEYAFDALKVDGVVLMTSFGRKWPGDPLFAPVFTELNRRNAVVYLHPTVPDCCRNLIPEIPDSTIEFPMDTTRAIVSLLYSGTFSRCPGIRFIFSHAGGMLPFVAERVSRLAQRGFQSRIPNGPMHELKKLFYETTLATSPMALSSLMHLVAASQVLFGSDFPFVQAVRSVEGLARYGFSADDLRAIERENALGLFPRLAYSGGRARNGETP